MRLQGLAPRRSPSVLVRPLRPDVDRDALLGFLPLQGPSPGVPWMLLPASSSHGLSRADLPRRPRAASSHLRAGPPECPGARRWARRLSPSRRPS
jgi:hypothetical protein